MITLGNMHVITVRAVLVAIGLCLSVASAQATCGTKGGPGYRGPDGKCVGWAAIGRVCGSPPTLRCTAEATYGGAEPKQFPNSKELK